MTLHILEESPGHFLLATATEFPDKQAAEVAAFLANHNREAWAPMESPQAGQILVRVYPTIKLPNISLQYEVPPVQQPTEDLIKSHLVDLQYRYAETEIVQRGAQKDDYLHLKIWAEANGIPVPGTALAERVLLRNDLVSSGFFMKLLNMKAGESRSFYFIAPNHETLGEWRKKKLHYHVQVEKVEAVTLPVLDDALAQKSHGVDKLADLILALRDELQAKYELEWQKFVKRGLLSTLAEQIEVEIPADLFAAEQYLQWANSEGSLLQAMGLTQAQLTKAAEAWAKVPKNYNACYLSLRTTLAVRQVVKEYGLEATPTEVVALLKPFAEKLNQPLEVIFNSLREEGTLPNLLEELQREKVADLLVQKSTLLSEGQVIKLPAPNESSD